MTMDKRKQTWLTNAPTEVLERVIAHLSPQEAATESSQEFPLGGLVHFDGVGQVPTQAIRGELRRRKGQ